MRRTTKEEKADALLAAAETWQLDKTRGGSTMTDAQKNATDDSLSPDEDPGFLLAPNSLDTSASCALSEVAGMGYDLLNADGTECEKVAEVDPGKVAICKLREDGTGYWTESLRPVRR